MKYNDVLAHWEPLVRSLVPRIGMVKLYRRWRFHGENEGQFSLPTHDDFRPMDTQEQEELVQSLERKQVQQSTLWKGVFAALLLCFAGFYLFSIIQQASSPWELRYHAYFMDEVDSWTIIFAGCIAVSACLMATMGLLQNAKSCRQWLWYSCYTGLLLAVFWFYHMLRYAALILRGLIHLILQFPKHVGRNYVFTTVTTARFTTSSDIDFVKSAARLVLRQQASQ